MSYVPFQVISSYSLLKSTVSISSLIDQACQKGYKAVALTDFNVLYGAIEFYEKAKQKNIKPILGMTLELNDMSNLSEPLQMVLLAKNKVGFQSLMTLSTKKMLDKISLLTEDIIPHQKELAAVLPICEQEELFKLVNNNDQQVIDFLKHIADSFDDFFVGINWTDERSEDIKKVLQLLSSYNINYLISEPVYYLDAKDKPAITVLNAIENQEKINPDSLSTEVSAYQLKHKSEVEDFYKGKGLLEGIKNTKALSEKLNVEFSWESVLPEFLKPAGISSEQYLEKVANEWLRKRIDQPSKIYTDRLKKELSVINKMGFADYFLIVWDLMAYAHKQNIVTGSGRGSAAGSLVSFVLRITDVDPIKYDLLFDRFLNEERFTLPDIDLDFPDDKREKILHYVFDKYGKDYVAQIATFGTFAAKMAIRDTGRTVGLSSDELKTWSAAIPAQPGISLKEAYNSSKEFNALVNKSQLNQRIFSIALRIEGLPRHVSTHAAGVVISRNKLTELTPLQEGSGVMPLTQYTMEDVERVGLLKMDFLGLKNLTILANCLKYTAELKGTIEEKLHSIDLTDNQTLELFKSGDTNGIFQFESPGIKRVLKKLGPDDFEDIVAVNALYRPGPMEQINTFIARKKGEEPIQYIHPDLEEILSVTNGIIVYQEQVMKVASKIAGYSLSEADILRRAISKKIKSEIDAGRNQFVAGAKRRGYSSGVATEIYNLIERFANYGFNRSHAVSYSKLAFQLAYFKAHFPASFYVSLLRESTNNKEKVRAYLLEAKKRTIQIDPPDINRSKSNFIVSKGKIVFGLDSIKGLRKDFIKDLLEERKRRGHYTDLINLITRLDRRWRKSSLITPLIQSGALDGFLDNRNTMLHSLEPILDSIAMSNGNVELFESLAPKTEAQPAPSLKKKLQGEFESTGFYLSGHPTEEYVKKATHFLMDSDDKRARDYIVQVEGMKKIQTKRGEPMAFVTVSDSSGEATAVLFPENYRKFSKFCTDEAVIQIKGKAEWKQGQLNILVNFIKETIDDSAEDRRVFLKIDYLSHNQDKLRETLNILMKSPGKVPVIVYDSATKRKEALKEQYYIDPTSACLHKLGELLGKENVILKDNRN